MALDPDKQITETTGLEIVLSVLESGHSVELPATGYSMFPALKPGDRAMVDPLPEGTLPAKGSVIVCMAQAEGSDRRRSVRGAGHRAQGGKQKPRTPYRMPHTILVMHRLVEIKKDDSDNLLLITRGDSMNKNDLPWRPDQIIGVVNSYSRNGRKFIIKNRIPYEPEYKINRLLLWFRNKL